MKTKELKNSYVKKKSDIGRKNNVKNYDKSRFNKEVTITSFKVKVRPDDIYRGDNYTHRYRLGNSIDKGGSVIKSLDLWKVILRLF